MIRFKKKSRHELEIDQSIVLELIDATPMTREELCVATGFGMPRVDQHLHTLKDCGLAQSTSEGKKRPCKWSTRVVVHYDINNHMPEFLGRESIFHVGMALAAGVRA